MKPASSLKNLMMEEAHPSETAFNFQWNIVCRYILEYRTFHTLFNIHFNIILSSAPTYFKCPLSLYAFFTYIATRPARLVSSCDHPDNV
jgi:hypothetical protein